MIKHQHPLGSGFTAASTADDVLDGVDLTGVNAVVTGGHSGIGKAVTQALARAGAAVTVPARNPRRAAEALSATANVTVAPMDLLDPGAIDAFASEWVASERPLHILINNAAVPTPGTVQRDSRGFEVQFATSHLGHFQLTLALHEPLRRAGRARVVNVSSGAHRFGRIRWDDPNFVSSYDPGSSYAQAKLANVLFAVALDERWAADGIRGFAVHPGVVLGTQLNSGGSRADYQRMGLVDAAGQPVIDPAAGKKTAEQGAATVVFGAASPQLHGLGGLYLNNSDVAPIDDRTLPPTADAIPADAISHALDTETAARLWTLSQTLLQDRQAMP
ncbi:SDR family NAD(P)-dependent oxidoreductase [Actinoplanes sp. LDG1-06]|uniref:SDR family NAD(P)-dependent oxidoreductase n=1 Tax=Paractinoplanes ovalisporus TaxID=2810368 RepID=A0ABS2AF88_9ACTN|nr:SDR family NAD(P)-dependent oxidoreductase [Actinoplanes ovalisporus]MBM2618495.1 SDR family NAD(P)-dependent oxidoreductase [Actinoplanes ovalisporus]